MLENLRLSYKVYIAIPTNPSINHYFKKKNERVNWGCQLSLCDTCGIQMWYIALLLIKWVNQWFPTSLIF
jgi:hypothetical protein